MTNNQHPEREESLEERFGELEEEPKKTGLKYTLICSSLLAVLVIGYITNVYLGLKYEKKVREERPKANIERVIETEKPIPKEANEEIVELPNHEKEKPKITEERVIEKEDPPKEKKQPLDPPISESEKEIEKWQTIFESLKGMSIKSAIKESRSLQSELENMTFGEAKNLLKEVKEYHTKALVPKLVGKFLSTQVNALEIPISSSHFYVEDGRVMEKECYPGITMRVEFYDINSDRARKIIAYINGQKVYSIDKSVKPSKRRKEDMQFKIGSYTISRITFDTLSSNNKGTDGLYVSSFTITIEGADKEITSLIMKERTLSKRVKEDIDRLNQKIHKGYEIPSKVTWGAANDFSEKLQEKYKDIPIESALNSADEVIDKNYCKVYIEDIKRRVKMSDRLRRSSAMEIRKHKCDFLKGKLSDVKGGDVTLDKDIIDKLSKWCESEIKKYEY